MILADRLTLDAPRITSEGYLAVRAKSARSGIYEYSGAEVDPTGTKFKPNDTVRVYRPDDEVFARDAVHSFLMKPVTDEHPTEAVTAKNWKDKARGVVAGAMRDGEFLAFDLVIMDQSLIDGIQSGKKELSNGYAVDLKIEAGTSPKGETYDAVQRTIRGNHVAVVKAGRAGPECRIADNVALCDSAPTNLFVGERTVATKTIQFDGISIEVTDQAAQAIEKLQGQVSKLTSDATASATAHTADIAAKDKELGTKDAKIEELTAKVLDAAALDKLVTERAALVSVAKSIHDADYSGKDANAIRRAVLTAKQIAHDGKSDDYVSARFDALADSAKDTDPLRDAITAIKPKATADKVVNDARTAYLSRLTNPNEKAA